MASCKSLEPVPAAVYSPIFYRSWLNENGIQWLGDKITTRYRRYKFSDNAIAQLNVTPELKKLLNQSEEWEECTLDVLSGPYCRIYWGNGKPEPHAYESAWREEGKKWVKPHANYISYDVLMNGLVTQFTVKEVYLEPVILFA